MKYEITLILSPKLTDENAEKEAKKLEKELTKLEVEILESKSLGKKDLAYKISNFEQGYYSIIKIEAKGSQVDKIKNLLKDNSEVIRVMVAKQDKEMIEPEEREKKREAEKKMMKKEKPVEKIDSGIKEKKEAIDEIPKKEEKKEDLDTKLDKILEEDIVD